MRKRKLHKERILNKSNQLIMVRESYKTKKGMVLTSSTIFKYLSEKDRKWSEKHTRFFFSNGLVCSSTDIKLSYHENGKIKSKEVVDSDIDVSDSKSMTEWFDTTGRIVKKYIESGVDGSSVLTKYDYDKSGNQYIDSQIISATSKYADIFEILGWFSLLEDLY